jgi:hypothetical protein
MATHVVRKGSIHRTGVVLKTKTKLYFYGMWCGIYFQNYYRVHVAQHKSLPRTVQKGERLRIPPRALLVRGKVHGTGHASIRTTHSSRREHELVAVQFSDHLRPLHLRAHVSAPLSLEIRFIRYDHAYI